MTNKITEELYGGKVLIDFFPDSHRYKKAGERTYLISVTGATGIIDKSRPLIIWATGLFKSFVLQYFEESKVKKFTAEELMPVIEDGAVQHTIKKEKAASIGSQVHEWCEMFVKTKMEGKEVDPETLKGLDENVENGINAFLDWYNSHKIKFLASERLVYSVKHDYVGIFDALAVIDGKTTLIDFKTSKRVYNEHLYQLSGYWNAVEEEDKVKLDAGLILHFDKETASFGKYEIDQEEHQKNLPVMLACLVVKRREKELSKW